MTITVAFLVFLVGLLVFALNNGKPGTAGLVFSGSGLTAALLQLGPLLSVHVR